MHEVVGIKFINSNRVYYFSTNNLKLKNKDKVIVETEKGLQFGLVVNDPVELPEEKLVLPLKNVFNKKIIAVNFEADKVEEDSDVMDIVMRTIDIMGNKIAEKSLEQSDLILTVPTDRAGLFDIEKLDKCYKFGYDTVINNLDKIKKVAKQK